MSAAEAPRPESQAEALEATREEFALWSRLGLETFAERFWDPELVWEEPDGFPDGGTRRGREASVRRMAERLELLGHVELELVGVTVPAPGWRLAEVIVHGQGSSSGAQAQVREWFLTERADGRVVRFLEYLEAPSAESVASRIATAPAADPGP